jgi:hypothetical protein
MSEPKTVKLEFVEGPSQELTIEAMPVTRFRRAWDVCDKGYDDIRLLDIAFNQVDGWSLKLTPESFTRAVKVMYDINPDFFGFIARKYSWRGVASPTG